MTFQLLVDLAESDRFCSKKLSPSCSQLLNFHFKVYSDDTSQIRFINLILK